MTEKDPRNPMRRVQFPEAGEGIELFLPNKGKRVIFNKLGEQWTQKVEMGLATLNVDVIDLLLDQMGHKNGERQPILFDDLDEKVLMTELADKLMDAYSLSMNGRFFSEQVAWLKEQEAANAPVNPPTTDLEDSLEPSSDEPTEPA